MLCCCFLISFFSFFFSAMLFSNCGGALNRSAVFNVGFCILRRMKQSTRQQSQTCQHTTNDVFSTGWWATQHTYPHESQRTPLIASSHSSCDVGKKQRERGRTLLQRSSVPARFIRRGEREKEKRKLLKLQKKKSHVVRRDNEKGSGK